MKGGAGDRRNGRSVTAVTVNGWPTSPSARARASSSTRTRTGAVVPDSSPVAAKSRPVARV